MPRTHQLPFLVVISNILGFAVLIVSQLIYREPVHYVMPQDTLGYDYRDFYYASVFMRRGESPYFVSRYVAPPLPAVINTVLVPLGFETARDLFLFITLLSVLISYSMIHLAFRDPSARDNDWLWLSGVLLIAFSYPFYFLLERGNTDGVVLLCMILGLILIPKQVQAGSLFLAVAILFKLYPLLMLAHLFFSRRWKAFFWTCGWMILLVVLTGSFWDDYFAASYHRSFFFRLDENGSLLNTLMIAMIFIKLLFTGNIAFDFNLYSSILTAIVYASIVVLMFYSDYKLPPNTGQKEYLTGALLYFPFMVAIPQLVYHYEFVVLVVMLPVLGFLWSRQSSRQEKIFLALVAIGMALSQWQAIALYTLTGNMLAQYVPGVGLLFMLTGISGYRYLQLKGHMAQNRPMYAIK